MFDQILNYLILFILIYYYVKYCKEYIIFILCILFVFTFIFIVKIHTDLYV